MDNTNLVALNPEALAAVSGMFASDLNTTAGVRMLSTARCKFTIKDGSEEGISLGDEFDGIIAAEDSADHFIYYKSKYDPSAVTAPDAVWYRNTKAPACVPESALVRDADGRLGYQVKRRIVVFPFYKGKLMPDPVAFDVSGQSLYKNADKGSKVMSYTQYRRFLVGVHALPIQVVTHFSFDPKSTVSVVRFSGVRGSSMQEMNGVLAQKEEVAELAKVMLKDGTESGGSVGQQSGYQPDGFKINPLPAPSPASAAPDPVSAAPESVSATAEATTAPAIPASQSVNTMAPASTASITEPDMDAAGALDSVLGDI